MVAISRRAALAAAGAGGAALALSYLLRLAGASSPAVRLADHQDGGLGMMGGVTPVDMRTYAAMFHRHQEINRVVEEIPGGVRTTTESDSPELAAELQQHVANMYGHLDGGAEVTCASDSLPILFRNAAGYRRTLTMTATGVVAEETADDPVVIEAIRAHAREVTGFVDEGMAAMMRQMGQFGGMGPGGMGPGGVGPGGMGPGGMGPGGMGPGGMGPGGMGPP